ncbi:hypothetical protein NW069_01905 [Mycoplasmopsis cynos]|nr:hypothetical protein [Mycoplasmopsis cynos]UWV80889.1 hypothetical protein NW069_01905 [Mycoplasmopsis cynos]WAM05606.1 hypothetical protein OM999_04755 [Mycoplasmopsis cynos]
MFNEELKEKEQHNTIISSEFNNLEEMLEKILKTKNDADEENEQATKNIEIKKQELDQTNMQLQQAQKDLNEADKNKAAAEEELKK